MKKIIKGLFVVTGVVFIIVGIQLFGESEIGAGFLAIIAGAACSLPLILKFKKKAKKKEPKKVVQVTPYKQEVLPGDYVKTFTFGVTGCQYECRFGDFETEQRQDAILSCKNGDIVYLKEYEWEGNTAFAVMDKKQGVDIGVVPERDVEKVAALMQKYDVKGMITDFDNIGSDEEPLYYPQVQLRCYEK